ncbi:hypothetical protein BD324DRAFT_448806 [Kockovaella imperatae]|uniref:Uncharacterized protein n=1 Tax=Kockovaella imperatae TaxID=4999 RepID=A0A1Y1UIT8_9TREE|nr:hypothetical protein BD324DRAFT_448806 [Kockovaella imperatae]ORX37414.1 hypothetical protein BD324DRAFT_448806 [Kockovaella imperatae]
MFNKHPSQFLGKTDPKDPAQVKVAVENMKKWARGKLKKGTLREVAGRGGKLEQLEIEFAHRGYQDIFYLTRFELSLPPSRLNLPQPSSPVAKTLADANFPLRNLAQSTPSGHSRKQDDARRQNSPEDAKHVAPPVAAAPTMTPAREDKGKRMTVGVKEITWGKQDSKTAPKVPTQASGPSTPPSPILYVPPRPPHPEAAAKLDSPIKMVTPSKDYPSVPPGAGVASTRPPGAGIASTGIKPGQIAPVSILQTSSTMPPPRVSMLDPSSATKTIVDRARHSWQLARPLRSRKKRSKRL